MEKLQWKIPFSKHLILCLIFTLGLIVSEFFLFPEYYDGFSIITHFQNYVFIKPIKIIALAIPSFLLSGFFVWAAFTSPYRYRIIYFLLFCLSVWTEYGYQDAFNRFTNSEDAASALFATDSRIIFNSMSYYFDRLAFIPCVIFAVLLIFVKPTQEKGLKNLLAVLLIFGGFFSFPAHAHSKKLTAKKKNVACGMSRSLAARTSFTWHIR